MSAITVIEHFDFPVSVMQQNIAHEKAEPDVREDPSLAWTRLDLQILNSTLGNLRTVPPSPYYRIIAGEIDWAGAPFPEGIMESYNDLYLDLYSRLKRFERLHWCMGL